MVNKSIFLFVLIFFLSLAFVSAFDFIGYVKNTDGITAVAGVNVTVYDPFSNITGEPWSTLTNSNGFFNVSNISNNTQATYLVVMYTNDTNYSNLRVGPIVPPLPAREFEGSIGPGGMVISLNNLNWTLRQGALINVSVFNETGNILLGGEIKDKKIDWPLGAWYQPSDYTLKGLVYVPRGRNYTATIWSQQSPPRGYLITTENISQGIYQLRVNSSTILVKIEGYLQNITANNQFTRIRAYWLIGGDTAHFNEGSSLDGSWASRFLNSTSGYYNHSVPSDTTLVICGYANTSVYYETCSNVTVGTNNINLNLTLTPLSSGATYDTTSEPNTTKVTFNLFKKYYNGTADVTELLTGRNYIMIKTTYSGKEIWWGLETNENGSAKLPIQNNSNISIKVFAMDGPPRKIDYVGITSREINITLKAMDQMEDVQGNELDAIAPAFYYSNSTCDLPNAPANCQIFNFSNASAFNPFRLLTLGSSVSVRLILPSGVVLHFKNVDILAGEPDVNKPTQTANTTAGATVTEAWRFGSMIPREMYESVLIGVLYNSSLISEADDFRLLITQLFNINASEDWVQSWNSSSDPNATSVPNYYRDFSNINIFNTTTGGITCSKTNTSADCYVDLTNDKVWFKINHFSGLSPSIIGTALTTTSTTTTAGGGGGGGGAAAGKTYTITAQQLSTGYTKELAKNDKFKFTIQNETHHVTLTSLTSTTATINVSSTSQVATLSIGEEKKFDVTDDDYYDISVKLNSINSTSNKASLIIKSVTKEEVKEAAPTEAPLTAEEEAPPILREEKPSLLWLWILIAVAVIVIVIIVFMLCRGKRYYKKGH